MRHHVYYYRDWRVWLGYWMDDKGNQLCESVDGATRDDVCIRLGERKDDCLELYRNRKEH